MNAYDAWLESPYQEAASYDEALEAAEEIESDHLIHELKNRSATRIELFDEACGYRTDAQADRITQAWAKQDAAAMLAVMNEVMEAQFKRTVEMRAIKECA